NKEYGNASFYVKSDKEDANRIILVLRAGDLFKQNGCIATVHFTVKQDTSTVTIYGGQIDACSAEGASVYFHLDDSPEDGGGKMMSVTVKDSSISEPTPEKGTFVLSNGTVKGNGEIMISVDIKTNDGFAALGLTINYDKDLFAYKKLEVNSKLKDKFELEDINPTDGQIKASFLAKQNITDVGSLLNLTLETKESTPVGTTSDVKITVTQVANHEEESLKGTGAVYTVTLADSSEQMLGDVNNDGKIDREDALCILQYYNDVKALTDDEKTAADVDKNGTVDLVDALRIMKYYNGEISEF
ncbi:MAG: hypothetical protein K2M91_13675, partial [Lachnospiraceae bacterium]|nr:hypothetical protein [Lachnospiraceae bacterium]